ncbi:UDP-N-acetylmuramate--L-alanine ligase [Sandaracinobacteroides saxicola]|uniref:UDP-N-acetylmuramate--L-alanine ligase n=1 Tax=Sandaracinobacteroides saxicola TaxID=2759707 RepID=A0A7G5IG82_9SPHN|nr:UDP-N-acetylmuramate--L-alanine ligase [Sandaracinobacteroides saxicola]QMW22374.1 UDP-N-acetylmuramate--L-alanine ligase [Sandaracinobacteroides saxicola]
MTASTFTKDIGPIHFIGIGGIGMSGIAEVMANLGYRVQGSDAAEGYVVQGLRDKGITIFIGQDAANLGDAAVCVVSTAIKRGNPEIEAAYERRIPVVRRAEMLAELMRLKQTVCVAGTHGKTTTTSMVAALLDAGGLDPTVINGGIINSYGSNARLGAGDWMVVEADESDGSFLRLPPTLAIVTNIDPEHLDHYGDFEKAKAAFVRFVEKVPFYGAAILCLDHAEVQAMLPKVADRRVITYGFAGQADVRGDNVTPIPGGNRFDVTIRLPGQEETRITGLELPMPGRHNVSNALSAIAAAHQLGIGAEAIRQGFARFGGVKRRFTKVGEVQGITIIDDYGHHPVEVKAVLAAAREGAAARVIAVVQPHRFTRLRDLFEEWRAAFNDADTVILTPVYPAGEAPIEGIDSEHLAAALKRSGHRQVLTAASEADMQKLVAGLANADDMVICLGAGDITKWAANLASALERLRA